MGPKGATIKRIQQQTRTYIVTPSRDKEPVFEVTGLPENVETARKEIEAHIAFRTQQQAAGVGGDIPANGFYGDLDDISSFGGSHSSNSCSTGCSNSQNGIARGSNLLQHQMSGSANSNSHQNLTMNGINAGPSGNTGIMQGASGNITNGGFGSNGVGSSYGSTNPSSFNSGFTQSSNGNGLSTTSAKGIILQNLIESNNLQDLMALKGTCSNPSGAWSTGDSHDSGIGSSPPFDGIRGVMSGMVQGHSNISNGVSGHNGLSQNMKQGSNQHALLSHQSSLPTSAESFGSNRGSGVISGPGLGSSSLLWGELNKALGGLDLSSSTASVPNNNGPNTMNQGGSNLNGDHNKTSYNHVGARSSLDLGSLSRSDQVHDQSASIGASALASQLLQHQQQNMSCGGNGLRSLTNRDILSDMDSTTNSSSMRGMNGSSSVLQQNLEELLLHQTQNIGRLPSSASSTISSSSPPDSLQHTGGMMQQSVTSSNLKENQSSRSSTIDNTDQNCRDPEMVEGMPSYGNTTSASTTLTNAIPISSTSLGTPTQESEATSDDGRNGICAI